jgi:nucleotide-binding universal stress UspA family protein
MNKGKLTALHIIEVPFSMPLESVVPYRLAAASLVLKTAEAIAIEEGIEMEMEIVRARSISDAILDVLNHDGFDLLLLESTKTVEKTGHRAMGTLLTTLIQKSPCRTWVCNSSTSVSLGDIAGIKK